MAAKEIPRGLDELFSAGDSTDLSGPLPPRPAFTQAYCVAAPWGAGLAPTSLTGSPLLTLSSTNINSQLLSQDTRQPHLGTTA